MVEELDNCAKVIVVGNGGVGKSSLIRRFCKGTFTKDYKQTIGVDFLERTIKVSSTDVHLMLWDTAGQEEYDSITKAYYRGAQACVLVFSTTDRESFLAIEEWKRKVGCEVNSAIMVLVQNKIDLIDHAVMSPEEVNALAKKLHLKLFRASVKEKFNVEEVFVHLSTRYLEQQVKEREEGAKRTAVHTTRKVYIGSPNGLGSSEVEEPFQIKHSKHKHKHGLSKCATL